MSVTGEVIDADGLRLVPVAAERTDAVLAGELGPYTAGAGWPHDDTAAALSFRAVDGMTWLVVTEGIVVGELGTKGPPDAERAVEIGYGLAAPSRGRGIGTRAVDALVEWLLARGDVAVVRAHVDPANEASVRLLRRLGFALVGHGDGDDVYERANTPLAPGERAR